MHSLDRKIKEQVDAVLCEHIRPEPDITDKYYIKNLCESINIMGRSSSDKYSEGILCLFILLGLSLYMCHGKYPV